MKQAEETITLSNVFMKRESPRIKFKKSHQLTNHVPYWIPKFVEPPAIIEDMMFGFNWIRSV